MPSSILDILKRIKFWTEVQVATYVQQNQIYRLTSIEDKDSILAGNGSKVAEVEVKAAFAH